MPKNIVICCDGTNGQFGLRNTNVVRLYGFLDQQPTRQVVFYDPGLGTMGAPGAWTATSRKVTKLMGLAFAYGLAERIGGAYEHLMETYEEGDHIYLFGFSRGAYTVRALASLLHMFGLLRRGNANLIPYVTDMFGRRDRTVFDLARNFKPTFGRDVEVHFVGVWDTVSSVGWVYDPVMLPYTANNPSIRVGRHAVSIDERRCFFRQNLWGPPGPGQDLKQVWFAGVHSDIGGGYPKGETGLANVTLWWMVDEAAQFGLLFDATKIQAARANPDYQPDPCGPIHDSLSPAWWPLELWPKRYWDSHLTPPGYRWKVPRGRPRFIAANADIHPSVRQRQADPKSKYWPKNCP